MAAPLYSTESGRLFHAGQILVSCVGLPARGKTHIARSILRYLRWLGVKGEVFSLGDYRRKRLGDQSKLPPDYFLSGVRSAESEKLREQVKTEMRDIVLKYFKDGGQVAIYDANNTTIAERNGLREFCAANDIHVMFIETICSDAIVERNIRAVKLSNPDYRGWDPEKAVADYWSRIQTQAQSYETIENPSFPYVKVIDIGERIIVNNIEGYLQSRIVFYLMNIHNRYRKIYMARSGASYAEHSYKADAGLSEVGDSYAYALRDFLLNKRLRDRESKDERDRQRRLVVWTSSRRRCLGTAKPFLEMAYKVIERGQMAEINPGIVDGLSKKEIKQLYPDEYDRSIKEPYSHRFPRAESYHDLSVRLEPAIFELERDRSDLLIIGHGSVLRCLFAYLKGLAPKDIPKVMIERGDLIEILPSSYGVTSKTHTFWRPPAGHEDIAMEPGTMPGTYGSPVHPPPNFLSMSNTHSRAATPHGDRSHLEPPRSPSGPHNGQSQVTPRMQAMTLEDLQAGSGGSSPASGRSGTPVSPVALSGAAGKHVWTPASPPKNDIALQDLQEQGEDEDPEGTADNYCEWEKARPSLFSNLSERRSTSTERETASEQQ